MVQVFGAEIIPISKEEGGFVGSIKLSEEMAAKRQECIFTLPVFQLR